MHNFNHKLEAEKYKVYKSSTIVENKDRIVTACTKVRENLEEFLGITELEGKERTTTWRHDQYNFWTHSMLVDPIFFGIWEDLMEIVKENSPESARGAWMQSWLNLDTYDSVEDNLPPHAHNCPIHGYISVDPKDTRTVFDEWTVVNEVGNIYVGLGRWYHSVENISEYDGERITIGFDVIYGDEPPENWNKDEQYQSFPWHPHWIPIILD